MYKCCCHHKNLLTVLILISLALQILLSTGSIVVTEYYKMFLVKYIDHSPQVGLSVELLFVELITLEIIFFYICGFILIGKSKKEPITPHLGTVFCIFHLFIMMSLISRLIMNWTLIKYKDSVKDFVEISMLRGIDSYYSDPKWRLLWDDIQYHEGCCGVQDYKDWETNEYPEDEADDDKGCYETEAPVSVTPYSCCKQQTNCFQDYSPQGSSSRPKLNLSDINTKGCLTLLAAKFHKLLIINLVLDVILLTNEVGLLVMMKYLLSMLKEGLILGKVDSECQATFVVKYPKNFECQIYQDNDNSDDDVFERPVQQEKRYQSKKSWKNRRKWSSESDDEGESSPFLFH